MVGRKNKKKSFSIKQSHVLWILIAGLVISQVVSFAYISKLRQSTSTTEDRLFLSFVNQTETLRYKQAVVSVSEQKVYIPDARIYIPLGDKDPGILYDARQLSTEPSSVLYLSTSTTVGNQRSLTKNETCDKLITISASKQPHATFIKEISPSKDGLRYIYLYDKNNCDIFTNKIWNDTKKIAEGIRTY